MLHIDNAVFVVVRQEGIVSDENHVFGFSLKDENAVEWVMM